MEVKKYIQENEARFIDELYSLLRIPSISAQSSHKKDIEACAEQWKKLLLEAGADPLAGHPNAVDSAQLFGRTDLLPRLTRQQ